MRHPVVLLQQQKMNKEANQVPKGILPEGVLEHLAADFDPQETEEWLEALQYVVQSAGPERAAYLLERLKREAFKYGGSASYRVLGPRT